MRRSGAFALESITGAVMAWLWTREIKETTARALDRR